MGAGHHVPLHLARTQRRGLPAAPRLQFRQTAAHHTQPLLPQPAHTAGAGRPHAAIDPSERQDVLHRTHLRPKAPHRASLAYDAVSFARDRLHHRRRRNRQPRRRTVSLYRHREDKARALPPDPAADRAEPHADRLPHLRTIYENAGTVHPTPTRTVAMVAQTLAPPAAIFNP